MDRRALIASFRVLAGDHGTPPLWDDEVITQYLNEAERRATRAASLLFDRSTVSVCKIPLVVSQREYRLHPKVWDVLSASLEKPGSNGVRKPVHRATGADMTWSINNRPNLSGWADAFEVAGEADGSEARGATLRLDRKPDLPGAFLYLEVQRFPLYELEDDGDEPEIGARHHPYLVDWALYRAYSTRDIEGSAAQRAETHKKRFSDYFGDVPDANVQRKQAKHRPAIVRPRRW